MVAGLRGVGHGSLGVLLAGALGHLTYTLFLPILQHCGQVFVWIIYPHIVSWVSRTRASMNVSSELTE
ncbi:hypothetical protein F5Y07DRAFT_369838 [Xylaria sp. FL0933]|nr:hypothetical protein F5Y07DRAFT_369838 [Xylaria sp. FL0933]